jgi:hypothetical protein
MNSYKVSVLSFLAGVGLAVIVFAPTVRRVPTLTARVEQLEKQVVEDRNDPESRLRCWQTETKLESLLGHYHDRIEEVERQLNQEHRACADVCPCLKTIPPHA